MKSLRTFIHTIQHLLAPPLTAQEEAGHGERPFFIIVSLVLMLIYGQAVYTSPSMRTPLRLIPFTALMLVHIALYWISPRFATELGRGVFYLSLQAALAFVLTLLAGGFATSLGMFPPLLGLALGLLHEMRRIAVAIALLMATSALSFGLNLGWSGLSSWAMFVIPTTIFVVIYVTLYGRQADARARAQALLQELETAHRQLAEYAERVEDLTLAAERQRMARELHDTLAQGLAGLILQLEAANSHLSSSHYDRAQVIVQQAMARARATLADARRAIDDLRQESVASDLAASVHREVNRFTTATSIACQVELALPSALPDATCEHILRIVTEGLTNIAQHAQATQAWVSLANANQQIEIEVRDNGIGFDPASSSTQPGHYGLLGMRERARLAGGTLAITSAAGQGTRLTLRLPL